MKKNRMIRLFIREHVRPEPGQALICGSRVYKGRKDRRLYHADAVGVDMLDGPGVDLVHDLEHPLGRKFSHVECMSVLEHCRRPWKAAETIQDALAPGGTLLLTVPFVWRVHAYPDDYWRMTVEGVRLLFERIEWQVLEYAHKRMTSKARVPSVDHDGWAYLARTEVFGFGRLRA